MAVVKSDGYGHGAVPCARAAREAGATWLGTATPEEALALRAAGLTRRPADVLAVDAGRAVAGGRRGRHRRRRSSGLWALREVVAAARARGPHRARPAQGRHRARPQRLPARRLARAGRRRPCAPRRRAPSGSPACGRTSPAPTSRATLDRRPARPSSARCSTYAERAGLRPRGAAHRQLARHADPARSRTSTSCGPGSPCTASRPAPEIGVPPTSGCGP